MGMFINLLYIVVSLKIPDNLKVFSPKGWASLNGEGLIRIYKSLTDGEADSRRSFEVYTHKGSGHRRVARQEQRSTLLNDSSKSKLKHYVTKCHAKLIFMCLLDYHEWLLFSQLIPFGNAKN